MIFDEINFPDLPESWTSLLVEDACDNVSVQEKTKTDKYLKSGNLAVVDQGASLIGGYINENKSVKTDLPVIVFGDHTRAIKYIDFPFAAGADGIKVLKPKKIYQPKLFYYFLRAIKLPNKGYARHFQYLRSSQIALPPLDEQKRITEKLDSLLTRVDSCQTHLERVPQILKRFRQSVLAAAMEGTLSEEWRLANNLDENSWQDTTLEEICVEDRVITYGVIKLGDDIPNGVPCLRTSNVRWLSIDEDGMKRIKPELSESYSRTILQGTEVLVNVRGTLGGVSVVKHHMIGWNVSREVAIAPLNIELASPEFIAIWIASNSSQNWLTRKQKGVAYTGINIEDLRQLPVKLPSLEEQAEIVRRVEKLFAYAERLEARYLSASERVARLTPSLLAKAFRGELVEQDPNDESAEKLLEKVRKSKEDSQAQKVGPREDRKGSKRKK